MLKNEMIKQQILKAKLLIKNLLASVSYVTLFVLFIALMIVVGISIYIRKKIRYETIKCQEFAENEEKLPNFKSWPSDIWDNNSTAPCLNDLQVISAYNCCSIGSNKASFVKLCALKNCLKMGARFLDFEIYDIDSMPFVATSSSLSFNYKESYNKLSLSEVLTFINTNAFSSDYVGNLSEYPIILHFRVKTNNVELFEKIKVAINESGISDNLLAKEKYGKNFIVNPTSLTNQEFFYDGGNFKTSSTNEDTLSGHNYPKPIGFVKVSEMKKKVVIIMKNYVNGENCGGLTEKDCYLPQDNSKIIGWGQYLEKGIGLDLCGNFLDPEKSFSKDAAYYTNMLDLSNNIVEYVHNLSSTQDIQNMDNEFIRIFTEGQADTMINDKKTNYGYYKIDKFNRMFLSMVIPELNSNTNYDGTKYLEEQFQIVCMKFQYLDSNLKKYIDFFKDSGQVHCFKTKVGNNVNIDSGVIEISNFTSNQDGAGCLTLEQIQTEQDNINSNQNAYDKKNKQLQLENLIKKHNEDNTCNKRIISSAPGIWSEENK